MPIDDKMCVSKEADCCCNEKCRDGRWVLYEEPTGRFNSIAENVEEGKNLPNDFQGSSNNEGKLVEMEKRWRWWQWDYIDTRIANEIRMKSRFWLT